MKDSFIFEGKKYISARRASEISEYSSDYIGQLCRAEKLDCRMIGRSWFVTEESIHLHQANVLHDEIYRNRIQNLKGGKKAQRASLHASLASTRETPFVPAVTAASSMVTEPSTVVLPTSPVVETAAPVIASKPIVSEIKYEADDRPLMPLLVKGNEELKVATPLPEEIQERYVAPPIKLRKRETYPEIARSLILRRALNVAIALILTVGVIAGGSFFMSSGASGVSQKVASASIHDALDSIASFVSGGFNSVLALFGHGRDVAVNDTQGSALNPTPLADGAPSAGAGIAVAPSSGNMSADEAMKQKIQASFSDQVEVHPDQSGTTGVITPVFREAKGKDFIYVMVPVNGARAP